MTVWNPYISVLDFLESVKVATSYRGDFDSRTLHLRQIPGMLRNDDVTVASNHPITSFTRAKNAAQRNALISPADIRSRL
jgi:hypothetical protein